LEHAIARAGSSIRDIALLIHTHAHFDHCGCSANLQEKSGAHVLIHKADAGNLVGGTSAPVVPIDRLGQLFTILQKPAKMRYRPISPDIIVEDELDLHPFGIDGRIISTPGHTPGSISILLANGEVIVGDLVGGGRLVGLFSPGRPRLHHWYTDLGLAKASLGAVLNTRPTRWYVGHGGPLDGAAATRVFRECL
jgi:glyoxylase-like metal-dependent hydrolase (beta-lactamase superfamily II)